MVKNSSELSVWKISLFKITNQLNKLIKKIFERINPSFRAIWESQYISGQWDHLKTLEQLAHYSIIIGYFQTLKKGGSLLDVGCGEGILHEKLGPCSYSKYVGIDISDKAIKQASQIEDEKTFFIRSDIHTFNTTETFDVIVFNEILYYFDKNSIINHLKRYENFLKEDGIYIISMYMSEKNEPIWRIIESICPLIDMTKVINRGGNSWICKVFFPPKR